MSAVGAAAAVTELNRETVRFRYTNPSKVRQFSPFRYPGGKTWLVPSVQQWMEGMSEKPDLFLEPFAGGASVGLAVAAAGLAHTVMLVEKDPAVASVWQVIINGSDTALRILLSQIESFTPARENIRETLAGHGGSVVDLAFRSIVRNRCTRGGIMAGRAGLLRSGERGKGVASRWYPDTVIRRIRTVRALAVAGKLTFEEGDGLSAIWSNPDAVLFVDPPYTASDSSAGSRLYTHHKLDHRQLFDLVADRLTPGLMSYDDTTEVRDLAEKHGMRVNEVEMQTAHHRTKRELIIVTG